MTKEEWKEGFSKFLDEMYEIAKAEGRKRTEEEKEKNRMRDRLRYLRDVHGSN